MKNLSIVAVTTVCHELTAKSIEQTIKVTNCDNVLILSDNNFFPGSKFVKIKPITQIDQYSNILFKELIDYVDTDHFMVVQYDGTAVDSKLWDDNFLKYDYIGAVWPWYPDGLNVGNGGFSLRSKKILKACQALELGPQVLGGDTAEDVNICRYYRRVLEHRGINFAPSNLARKFSAEFPGGRYNTFGFHGMLCLPYYLDDEHMHFYINHLTEEMLNNVAHTRLAFGLFNANRYEHLEHFMDHAININPNFKQLLFKHFLESKEYFPEFELVDLENLLINY